MTFLDRTFCSSPNCKGECGRQWTANLQERAKQWWGPHGEPPVAFSYFCGEGVELVEDAAKKQEDNTCKT